jgi:hypothetical protein
MPVAIPELLARAEAPARAMPTVADRRATVGDRRPAMNEGRRSVPMKGAARPVASVNSR